MDRNAIWLTTTSRIDTRRSTSNGLEYVESMEDALLRRLTVSHDEQQSKGVEGTGPLRKEGLCSSGTYRDRPA